MIQSSDSIDRACRDVQTINNVSFIAKKVLDDTGPTEKRKHGVGNTPMQGPASRRIADPGQNLRLPQQTFNFEPHIFTCQRANKFPSNTGEGIPKRGTRSFGLEVSVTGGSP